MPVKDAEIQVTVSYPATFIKELLTEFPDDTEFHKLAIAGKYELGRKIVDGTIRHPNQRKRYYDMFSKWAALPCVLDMTTRIMIG